MKTWTAKEGDVTRRWYVIDAKDQTVGRLATEVANLLRGKGKPQFTPHIDVGDFVIVINGEKVKFTGDKWNSQKYYRHSRFFGSLKEATAAELLQSKPDQILVEAVQGMLPKTKLARAIIKKLKVYAGGEHPHAKQKPEAYSLN